MTPTQFIAAYGPAAQQACHGTGLLASICLAQAALESGWGASDLTKEANNFFGMKAGTRWKGAVVTKATKEQLKDKSWVTVQAAFRKYATPADSFRDRVALFRGLARYQRLFQLTDAQTEARQLVECGYATDQLYSQKLMSIVRMHNLTRFDS
jgi:flagellum-specific peptidoglycan hydrolase FlgJ